MPESGVERMNQYRELQSVARNIRENALRADDAVDNVMWIAGGGRGTGNLDELEKLADALEGDAEYLRELAEEATDPREVRDVDY